MVTTATPPPRLKARHSGEARSSLPLFAAIVILSVICVMAFLLHRFWPFAEGPILQNLREASDSQVKVRAFHETYFPSPGCVLEGVVFNHSPNEAKPLITIEKLTIEGSYPGLIARHVSRIVAEGMRISIPPFGSGAIFHTTPSKISVGEITANGTELEFAVRDSGKEPLRFDIHEASLRDVGWSGALAYNVKVHNPEPPGEVTATGKFGVWNTNDAGETPVSGKYRFDQADLSVYDGVSGTLSSTGSFSGKLRHIDISGVIDTPDFAVKSGGHPVKLSAQYSAYVDAIKGDTFLKKVDADFWKTHISAQGSIAGSPDGSGKIALIDLRTEKARIEDILRLFVNSDRPPMSGTFAFQARAQIPSGDEKFLKKVKLRGSFGIAGGTFSKPSTQQDVDKLSSRSRGEKDSADPQTVMTDLTGQENLQGGIATFSDLSFGVPGAAARVHGTYSLINHKIDLHGQLKVDSELSKTQSGTKAVLLKAIQPFFKKRHNKEIVPIQISGTYDHPSFGLDLGDKKTQNAEPPRHKSSKSIPNMSPAGQSNR